MPTTVNVPATAPLFAINPLLELDEAPLVADGLKIVADGLKVKVCKAVDVEDGGAIIGVVVGVGSEEVVGMGSDVAGASEGVDVDISEDWTVVLVDDVKDGCTELLGEAELKKDVDWEEENADEEEGFELDEEESDEELNGIELEEGRDALGSRVVELIDGGGVDEVLLVVFSTCRGEN